MAVLSIQDLTVKYFEITAKAQKGEFPSRIIFVRYFQNGWRYFQK